MGKVTRFIPKAERIKADQAASLRQMILDFELPDGAEADILVAIQRHETGGVSVNWNFNMFSPMQCLELWGAIDAGERPQETRKIFDLVITHIETNSGRVTLTRDEMADKVGIAPKHVSAAMKRLEDLGAIIRGRIKTPGMRGPGRAIYRVNPHVGWNGGLSNRAVAAEKIKPPFEVISGGRDPRQMDLL